MINGLLLGTIANLGNRPLDRGNGRSKVTLYMQGGHTFTGYSPEIAGDDEVVRLRTSRTPDALEVAVDAASIVAVTWIS